MADGITLPRVITNEILQCRKPHSERSKGSPRREYYRVRGRMSRYSQRLRLHARGGTRTFRRCVHGAISISTDHIEYLQLCHFLPQRVYRIVREQPTLTGSRSDLFNAFYRSIVGNQRSYHIVRENHDVTSLDRALSYSTRFTGQSSATSAPTTSSAKTTTSPSRNHNDAAHSSTTTVRGSTDFVSTPYIFRFQD